MKKLFEMVGSLIGPKKDHLHFLQQGTVALEVGDYAEAERQLSRALELAEEARAHTEIARAALGLAKINEHNGKLAIAETHFRKAYTTHEESEEFEDAAACLVLLGRLYYKQRRYPDAEKVLQYAMSIYQTQLSSRHEGLAEAASTLASCYVGQNSFAEAQKLLERARDIYRDTRSADDPLFARSLHMLAMTLSKQGKLVEAEQNFERAVDIYRSQKQTMARAVAHEACACYHDFIRHYLDAGKAELAQSLTVEASALCDSHPGYLDEADLVAVIAATRAHYA